MHMFEHVITTANVHSHGSVVIYRYDINPIAFDYLWINTNGYGCLDLHTLLAIPACSADVLVPHFFPPHIHVHLLHHPQKSNIHPPGEGEQGL